MAIENEVKLLGVDVNEIREFLLKNKIHRDQLINFRRVIFDTIPVDNNAWIRLRTDGSTTSLTYKKSQSNTIDGMHEIETITGNFDDTRQILTAAGLKARNYQENRREVYNGFDCMITIDFWPLIPPYVEIEAASKEQVEACLLKFTGLYERATSNSTESVYQSYGIDLRSIDSLTFRQ